MAIFQPQQYLKYNADSLFSLSIGEQGIRVSHRSLLRYFIVCTQPENLRAFCSVLLLTNYFFNVQQHCCHLRSRLPIKPCHVISYGRLCVNTFISFISSVLLHQLYEVTLSFCIALHPISFYISSPSFYYYLFPRNTETYATE